MRQTTLALLLTLFCTNIPTQPAPQSMYFDTNFLSQYEHVYKSLVHNEGFIPVIIPTHDGLNLAGLFLERSNSRATVIICCGFYPGRKEGMATLYKLLPEDVNILFFDARGHGSSEGSFWSTLYAYGTQEYHDVIGAIAWAYKKTHKPIVIYSICAGSYHALNALVHMQKQALCKDYPIKGLIVDSGFGSLHEVCHIPRCYAQHTLLPSLFKQSLFPYCTKQEIRASWFYNIIWFCFFPFLYFFEWIVKQCLYWQQPATSLYENIANIPYPIFFIHAHNDRYASCTQAQLLARNASRSVGWWIQHSSHACNHLKHATEYRIKLEQFLRTIL